MSQERIKAEHAGPKNGGGSARATRAEAKQGAKRQEHRIEEIVDTLSTDEHEDRWAMANAREAIREERWQPKVGS